MKITRRKLRSLIKEELFRLVENEELGQIVDVKDIADTPIFARPLWVEYSGNPLKAELYWDWGDYLMTTGYTLTISAGLRGTRWAKVDELTQTGVTWTTTDGTQESWDVATIHFDQSRGPNGEESQSFQLPEQVAKMKENLDDPAFPIIGRVREEADESEPGNYWNPQSDIPEGCVVYDLEIGKSKTIDGGWWIYPMTSCEEIDPNPSVRWDWFTDRGLEIVGEEPHPECCGGRRMVKVLKVKQ